MKMLKIKLERENDHSITFDWPASFPRILFPVDFVCSVTLFPFDIIYYLFDLPTPRDVGPNLELEKQKEREAWKDASDIYW